VPAPTLGVAGCRLLELRTTSDRRGALTVLEAGDDVPFAIARVFYLHAVPNDQTRAGHAHRQQEQVIVAVSGSFDVRLDDGGRSETVALSHPDRGLYVPPLVWREIRRFSPEAVCLVLASTPYRHDDYCSDYERFRREAARAS
jgi:dTDP-4-dehydrorhamnose 3,5-epimerase-like enzyme